MNRTIFPTFCFATALMAGLSGCATRGADRTVTELPAVAAAVVPAADLEYTVKSGDRLGDIARQTTGSAANWRIIANVNLIDDPRLLRPGTVLSIPGGLMGDAPVGVPIPDTDITEATLPGVAARPVLIEPPDRSDRAGFSLPAATRSVKVSGSYYPRGIYAEPSGSARLVMRATPGSLLPLERTIDNWYRVTTSQGAGYIRASDARIVDSSATPGSTASSD